MNTNSKPISFADYALRKTKITRIETFLQRALKTIDLSFTKKLHLDLHNSNTGRKPYDTLVLFKILLLQQWFGLSDPEAEEQVHDRKSFQDFLGLKANDEIPDETTICRFRNNLIKKEFDKFFFKEIEKQLKAKGIEITKGKIVDATIIETPKGRKKQDGTNTRDPEASFTQKNSKWYHGYKGHISTDTKGKFIQKCYTSTAKDHDSKHEDKVLDGNEKAVFEDSAYANTEKKKQFRKEGKFYGIVERKYKNKPLSNKQKKRNKKISSVRCRGEHPFAEIKCRMKFKTRYKSLIKNNWQFTMVSAAYNLKRLIGQIFPTQEKAVVWIY